MKINPDELLTLGEAATLRGVTRQSINYLVKMRRVRTVSVRGRTFVVAKDIEDYKPGKRGPRPKEKEKGHAKKKGVNVR
jgi:RNA-binding protein YhbY